LGIGAAYQLVASFGQGNLIRVQDSITCSWNVQRFRGGLVVKAHRLLYHSTLGLRVMKQRKGMPNVESVNIQFRCRAERKHFSSFNLGMQPRVGWPEHKKSLRSSYTGLYPRFEDFPQHPCRDCGPGLVNLARVPRERYRGTSPIRKRPPLGPYSRPVPRGLGWY